MREEDQALSKREMHIPEWEKVNSKVNSSSTYKNDKVIRFWKHFWDSGVQQVPSHQFGKAEQGNLSHLGFTACKSFLIEPIVFCDQIAGFLYKG